MITIIRDGMMAMIRKADPQAGESGRLARGFDTEYGKDSPGSWGTDKFVEAAYQSLTQRK